MDLSSLLLDNQPSLSIIEEGIDPLKHAKILATLCSKRKLFEQTIANKEINDGGETVIALMQLKNDMALFGISEIDYQAHLAKDTALKSADELAPPGTQTQEPKTISLDTVGLDSTG